MGGESIQRYSLSGVLLDGFDQVTFSAGGQTHAASENMDSEMWTWMRARVSAMPGFVEKRERSLAVFFCVFWYFLL